MTLKVIAFAAAIFATAATPAFAAPTSNPASALSIGRASAPSHGKSKLHGEGGIIVAVLAAGIIGAGIYAVSDNKSRPASN